MRLPEHVQIGPYRYRIVADEHAINRERVKYNHVRRIGEMNYATMTITIDPDMAPDALCDTLLHEVLHCINVANGLPEENLTEEHVVETMSAGVLDFLRRNPELLEFLLRPEDQPEAAEES